MERKEKTRLYKNTRFVGQHSPLSLPQSNYERCSSLVVVAKTSTWLDYLIPLKSEILKDKKRIVNIVKWGQTQTTVALGATSKCWMKKLPIAPGFQHKDKPNHTTQHTIQWRAGAVNPCGLEVSAPWSASSNSRVRALTMVNTLAKSSQFRNNKRIGVCNNLPAKKGPTCAWACQPLFSFSPLTFLLWESQSSLVLTLSACPLLCASTGRHWLPTVEICRGRGEELCRGKKKGWRLYENPVWKTGFQGNNGQ